MTKKHTKHDVFDDIRWRIMTLDLAPGSDLDEGELVKAYGVSRTPIRETLIRLQGEGLVELKENRGAYVAPLDFPAFQAYFEAAVFITRAISRLAATRRQQTDVERILAAKAGFEAAMREGDEYVMARENNFFHDWIGQAARNKYLYGAYRRLLADHERIAVLLYRQEIEDNDTEAQSLTLSQHDQLAQAIVERDASTAERVSTDHLNLCKEGLATLLEGSRDLLDDIAIAAG